METKIATQTKKRISIIMVLFILSIHVFATGTVKGKVTDSKGDPLIGCSIAVVNSTNGTFTEFDGSYSIVLAAGNYKLEVAYVGFKTKVVSIIIEDNKEIIQDVTLLPDSQQLETVVKIGYASAKPEDMTGAITQISGYNTPNHRPVMGVDKALQGKAAGVQIRSNSGSPGAASNIVIRGIGSTSSDPRPMYVVDGVPVGSQWNGDPNTVESISILKDASSCAIYGSRGANGVVLISTKGGNSLQGRAAGVQVKNSVNPMNVSALQINRGVTFGDQSPLYIVDGIQVGTDYKVDANDIESIAVLKDISSTSIYGPNARNGVILITTNGGNYYSQQSLSETQNNSEIFLYKPFQPQPQPQIVLPTNEEYKKIVENPMKDAVKNPISTFSIDVDKASYSNVRRFLDQNQKPVPDAVRLEEMINYFTYNYQKPTDGTPFSINMESQTCPWNAKNKLVLIGLQGKTIQQQEIPANNLVFLIDVSGSMSDANKLPLIKEAFTELVVKLRPQDRISIVTYASSTGVVLEPTAGSDKAKILSAIYNLSSGGSTAGGAGITLAYEAAKASFIKGGNNRVILATDGDFNVGASSDEEMVKLIESKRNDGIFLSVLGFGMGNYKDSKMEQIADAGNGNYAYIDTYDEAKKVFGVDLWGTLVTIAKDVKIQVEFNPATVASYRLIGYEDRMLETEDFENDKKDAGEIGAGHTVTALYEITLQETPITTNDTKYIKQTFTNSSDLMTVNIRYKEPNENVSKLITKTVQKDNIPTNENIKLAASVAQFGMLLRGSEYSGSSTFNQILQTVKNIEINDENGYRKELVELVEKANKIY